jgi:IgA Peptidase M64.
MLPCMLWAQYDKYFENAALRADYYLYGNAKETHYALKELIKEPYWGGSKSYLIDELEFGNYFVKVFEAETENLLFSKGYCNLFGEWQTTPEAETISKGFEESVVFPFPKQKVDVVLYYKNNDDALVEGFRFSVSPDDYFIQPAQDFGFSVFDAWIGSPDHSKAVDIVILPEGYTQKEMGKFVKDCEVFVESLFSYAPYDRYKKSFNVRGVMAPSEESGCDEPGDHVYKNTGMNFTFWTFDSERYCMSTDNKSIRDLAGQVPYDQIYILVNTEKYGGGGIYNFYCSSAIGNSFTSDIIIHEFGHGFAGLADEYYDDAGGYEEFYNLKVEPWEPNITTLVDFDKKWSNMVEKGLPVPTPRTQKYENKVGVFEGGGYEPKGVYSPVMDCLMKSFRGDVFCPVCQKAIERMIRCYSE